MITSTTSQYSAQSIPLALDIPYVTEDEAYTLLASEFQRFMQLLETLSDHDWTKPTACTAWTVKDILAHQAGGYASGTGYREMIRQYTKRPKPGQLPEDAVNDQQVIERRDRPPDEIIAELRKVASKAMHNWVHGFKLAKMISIPHPVSGTLSLRHLMWILHSRDTWMHRLDICRATGRQFEQSVEHDGRIAALVMLDVARKLEKKIQGKTLVFDLIGVAGGTWHAGSGVETARLRMNVLDFNIFVSGRYSYEEGLARAELSGDKNLLKDTLKDILILF